MRNKSSWLGLVAWFLFCAFVLWPFLGVGAWVQWSSVAVAPDDPWVSIMGSGLLLLALLSLAAVATGLGSTLEVGVFAMLPVLIGLQIKPGDILVEGGGAAQAGLICLLAGLGVWQKSRIAGASLLFLANGFWRGSFGPPIALLVLFWDDRSRRVLWSVAFGLITFDLWSVLQSGAPGSWGRLSMDFFVSALPMSTAKSAWNAGLGMGLISFPVFVLLCAACGMTVMAMERLSISVPSTFRASRFLRLGGVLFAFLFLPRWGSAPHVLAATFGFGILFAHGGEYLAPRWGKSMRTAVAVTLGLLVAFNFILNRVGSETVNSLGKYPRRLISGAATTRMLEGVPDGSSLIVNHFYPWISSDFLQKATGKRLTVNTAESFFAVHPTVPADVYYLRLDSTAELGLAVLGRVTGIRRDPKTDGITSIFSDERLRVLIYAEDPNKQFRMVARDPAGKPEAFVFDANLPPVGVKPTPWQLAQLPRRNLDLLAMDLESQESRNWDPSR